MRNLKQVFILFLSLMLLVAISSCGVFSETPEQAVTKALDAVKAGDKVTFAKYSDYNKLLDFSASKSTLLNSEETSKLLLSKFSYKVLSSSTDGNTATVKTEITNIDLKSVLANYMSKVLEIAMGENFDPGKDKESEAKVNQQFAKMFTDQIKNPGNKTVTNTVDIQLTKTKDGWTININKDLQNALSGGFTNAMSQISSGLSGSDSAASK